MRCLGLFLLSLLLMLASCSGGTEVASTVGGSDVLPSAGCGEVTVRAFSVDDLPAGVSQTVVDWVDECLGRTHLTDAILYSVTDGVCELLLLRTALENEGTLSATVDAMGLALYTVSTAQNAQSALFYLSFYTSAEDPRFSLTVDGEAVGILLRRISDESNFSVFRTVNE